MSKTESYFYDQTSLTLLVLKTQTRTLQKKCVYVCVCVCVCIYVAFSFSECSDLGISFSYKLSSILKCYTLSIRVLCKF